MAAVAAIDIFGRDGVVAGGTVNTVPLIELSIGRRFVVSSQDLTHENEELAYQPGPQSSSNSLVTVAFAERRAADMRVWVTRRAFVGVDSIHRVRRGLVQSIQLEPDLKRAEINLFKHDAFGGDGQLSVPQVNLHSLELVFQRRDLGVELTQ